MQVTAWGVTGASEWSGRVVLEAVWSVGAGGYCRGPGERMGALLWTGMEAMGRGCEPGQGDPLPCSAPPQSLISREEDCRFLRSSG